MRCDVLYYTVQEQSESSSAKGKLKWFFFFPAAVLAESAVPFLAGKSRSLLV